MRWRGGLQTGDQSELRNLPKVGVLVGAVLGLVPELSLDGFDGVTARGGLAGHRMAAHFVVTELAKTESSLDCTERSLVGVDADREGPVLAEQELGAGVSLADVPADGVGHILGEG